MRKVIENQLDLHSRGEIPQVLLGLQGICGDRQVREEFFNILESIIPEHME